MAYIIIHNKKKIKKLLNKYLNKTVIQIDKLENITKKIIFEKIY